MEGRRLQRLRNEEGPEFYLNESPISLESFSENMIFFPIYFSAAQTPIAEEREGNILVQTEF